MQMILHTPEEIKGTTWQKVQRQLKWLNKHLTQALTADDPEWRAIEREHYLKLLPAVHINGAAGSLLDVPASEAPENSTHSIHSEPIDDYGKI